MGALTNKPMAFNSRNWEYNTQLTFDLTDFLSPRIRVDQFNGKVYRILPTVEWISNRIRFLYLGLRNQRLNNPITSYLIKVEMFLHDKTIYFEKKVLMSNSYQKAFDILKTRLILNKSKNVNLIYGSVFDANLNVFKGFETISTKVLNYAEFSLDQKAKSMVDFSKKNKIVLFGVNPRMESPLLNLKIKDFVGELFSIGNFSFSYLTKVITNNSIFNLYSRNGFFSESFLIFGLSTMEFSKKYKGSKLNLIPLYLFNNALLNNFSKKTLKKNHAEDVTLYVSNQMLLNNSISNFEVSISSHFENNKAQLSLPISGYLETNLNYLDSELKTKKINSLIPNFGLSDLLSAFSLYICSVSKKEKFGAVSEFLSFKEKIKNTIVNNSVPNYLIRDPLGRANPLFNRK